MLRRLAPLLAVSAFAVAVAPRASRSQPASCPECVLGIFEDRECSIACGTIEPGTRKDLYVGAKLGGTVTGLLGIEFSVAGIRLDVDGILLLGVEPVTPAAAQLGDPIAPRDTTGTTLERGGINVAWRTCLEGERIPLVKLTILSFAPVHAKTLWVLRRFPPTNPAYTGPVIVLCDAPVFTAAIVTSGCHTLNAAGTPNTCYFCIDPVAPDSWSHVKSLYRD